MFILKLFALGLLCSCSAETYYKLKWRKNEWDETFARSKKLYPPLICKNECNTARHNCLTSVEKCNDQVCGIVLLTCEKYCKIFKKKNTK